LATTKVRAEGRGNSTALADRLLDVNEASSLLGLKPRTLYKMAYAGRVPVVKIGRASRFRLSTLERLIAEWERPSTRPLQAMYYYP
jgi:excisionase family DNA binding protein